MKTKVQIQGSYYGDIRGINGTELNACIYDSKTHNIVDNITFDITEFPEHERKDVSLNVVFTMRVGYIGKKAFCNIRLKKRTT